MSENHSVRRLTIVALAVVVATAAATSSPSRSQPTANQLPSYPIHAKFDTADKATHYWIVPSEADKGRMGVEWRLVIPTLPFDPPPAMIDAGCKQTKAGKDRFEFIWRHGEEPETGGCKHAIEGRHGHQGIVHVVMVNKFGRCEAYYIGTTGPPTFPEEGPAPKCTTEAATPDCSELADRLAEVRAELAAINESLMRLDATERAAEKRIKKAQTYLNDDLTQKIAQDPDVKPFIQEAEAELRAAEKERNEAEAAYQALVKHFHQVVKEEGALDDKLQACLKHKGAKRLSSGVGQRAACAKQRLALASAEGQSTGYNTVVRFFRKVDFDLASAKLRDAAQQLRTANAKPRARPAHAKIAAAIVELNAGEAALKRAAGTIASAKNKADTARTAVAKAKAALAKCRKGG